MYNSFLKNLPNQSTQQLLILTEDQLKGFAEEIVKQTMENIASSKKDDKEKLLTRKEVCKMVSRTSTTLWRWDKDGTLKPASKGTKGILYRKGDVDDLLYGKSKLMAYEDE